MSIYTQLINGGLSHAGVCAVIGNVKAESAMRANNAQDGMTRLSDEEYTAKFDADPESCYRDSVGYGLCQWTYWSRKKALWEFTHGRGKSVGDEETQAEFIIHELKTGYSGLYSFLCTTDDLYTATDRVCREYENPAVKNVDDRYEFALSFYEGEEQTTGKKVIQMTVKQKQCLLYYLGYYVGNIDGKWGTCSTLATKAFQKDYGLEEDGIFGSNTEKKILSVIATGEAPKRAESTGDFWDEIEFFDKSEFKCNCGGVYCDGFPAEPKEKLVRVADKVRRNLGAKATVSSGVRCTKHNKNVGGVPESRHLSGKAMDFRVVGKTASQLLAEVKKHSEIRYAYAIDGNYVHMDIN